MTPPHPFRRVLLHVAVLCVVLVAATVWAYRDIVTHEFLLFDDNEYVTEHPMIRRGLGWEAVVYVFTQPHHATWHPLTGLSHLLDVTLFGLSAPAHLAVNLAWHCANAVLLFTLWWRLLGTWTVAFWIAAAFALHPLHVESVAWVSERKDVLSTFFALAAIHTYVTWVRQPQELWWVATAVFFALGLLAKPMVVTLPLLLLLMDFWPLGRVPQTGSAWARWWPLAREKTLLWVFALGATVVTLAVQSARGAVEPLAASPVSYRLANALVAYALYLRDTVWPLGLAVFYPRRPLGWAESLAAAGLLAGISTVAWKIRRQAPWALVGWLWYLVCIAPVSGLLQAGDQARADRFTYLALTGIFLWAGGEARRWAAQRPLRVAIAGFAAVATVAGWTVLTDVQVRHWKNTETLFRHALAVTRENHVAHANLGAYLLRQGRTADALVHLHEAVRLRPFDALARLNLGVAAASQGKWEEAIQHYRSLLAVRPDHVSGNFNLALALLQVGQRSEARARLEAALRVDPQHAKARVVLGDLLQENGELEQAVRSYRQALAADPDLLPAHVQLARALEREGKIDEALAHYREATRLAPSDPRTWFNLAAALHDAGRTGPAREAFLQARAVAERIGDREVAERARQALGEP